MLLHDQTADETLSLTSWYNVRGPLLCFDTHAEEEGEDHHAEEPEYSNLGEGKCADVLGNAIKDESLYDYYQGQGAECEEICSADETCTGYSVSIYENCLIWQTPLAEAHPVGQHMWGGADCHRKNDHDDHDDDHDHDHDHGHGIGDVSVHLYVTHAIFTDDQADLSRAACIEEGNQMGISLRMADWVDVYIEDEHDPEGIALEITQTMTDKVWFVTANDGELKFGGGDRQYFVRRRQDDKPNDWLTHDITED